MSTAFAEYGFAQTTAPNEAELVKAGQEQNLYYSHGEKLAADYNAAQIRFSDCDARLNQLKTALEEI